MKETPNQLIHIGKPIELDMERFQKQLEILNKMAEEDKIDIRKYVSEIVPTYQIKEGDQ